MGRVICVTGMPGCGKEEFVRVAQERGLAIVRMGDVVREEAKRRGLKFSDETVGGMAHEERVRLGFGIWAERTVPHVGDAHEDFVRAIMETTAAIVRNRPPEYLEVPSPERFRRAFGEALVVVAIHASPKMRYGRILKRGRGDDILSHEEFHRREERELGWGLAEVIATADFVIVNEGTLDAMQARSHEVLDAVAAG